MSPLNKVDAPPARDKELLRIALDVSATSSYESMVKQIKATGNPTRFHPSSFVSFLVTDFFETYFDKDIDAYVAKFFDSKTFLATEIQRAHSPEDTTAILRSAMESIDKVTSQGRNKKRTKRAAHKKNDVKALGDK